MGQAVQVRIREKDGYNWNLVYAGETVDLPEKVGLVNGFEKVLVTQGKIGKEIVETKQFDSKDYSRELINIKGINKKTAEDIITVFPTREDLIKAIKEKRTLPFRDDIEKKLRREYGRR